MLYTETTIARDGLLRIAKAIAFLGLCLVYAHKSSVNTHQIVTGLVKIYKEDF